MNPTNAEMDKVVLQLHQAEMAAIETAYWEATQIGCAIWVHRSQPVFYPDGDNLLVGIYIGIEFRPGPVMVHETTAKETTADEWADTVAKYEAML